MLFKSCNVLVVTAIGRGGLVVSRVGVSFCSLLLGDSFSQVDLTKLVNHSSQLSLYCGNCNCWFCFTVASPLAPWLRAC